MYSEITPLLSNLKIRVNYTTRMEVWKQLMIGEKIFQNNLMAKWAGKEVQGLQKQDKKDFFCLF